MRLATRCPSCTTLFLVVPDQLRVSDGWVRCGRCGNVFNAGESLLDVDTGTPARLDLGSRPPAAPAPTPATEPAAPTGTTTPATRPRAEPGLERQDISLSARPAEPDHAVADAAASTDPTGHDRVDAPASESAPEFAPAAPAAPAFASVPKAPAPDAALSASAVPLGLSRPTGPTLPDVTPGAPEAPEAPRTAPKPVAEPAATPWPTLADDGPDDSARLDQWDTGLPALASPPAAPAPASPSPLSTASAPDQGTGPVASPGWGTAGVPSLDMPPAPEDDRWQARTVLLGELADEVELDSDVTDPWAPPEPARGASTGSSTGASTGAAPQPGSARARAAHAAAALDDASNPPEQLLRAPSRPAQTADQTTAQAPDQPAEPEPSEGWSALSEPAPAGDTAAAASRAHRPATLAPDPGQGADDGPSTGPLLNEVPPSFVRHAERAAFWRSRPVRVALLVLAVLLTPLALLQAALVWRDPLAARVPALAEPLAAACAPLGCTLQPLRRIGQLSVEGSALNLLEDTPGPDGLRYRLNVQLRNRADLPLMAPAIELALTDVRGELVSRRVLRMSDFGARAPDTLAAQEELSLRLVLAAGPHRIEGYTVELFYP